MTSIVEVIQHYQRSIDSSQDNEARLLHCINKLYKLPIKVEHLQETGVGKTVNSLRKFNGEIGVAAKTLVTKWKAMVAAEEEPMDTTSQTNEDETHDNNNDDDNNGDGGQDNQDDENHNLHNNNNHHEQNKHSYLENDKHKEKHKERSNSSNGHKESRQSASSSHHHSGKSSKHSNDKHKSSSSKDNDSHHHKSRSSSSNKEKEREKEKTEHKSSKDKHKDKDHDKERDRSEKRKEEKHKTDKDIKIESSSSHKSSSSSSSKSKHDDKHQSSSKEKDKERSEKHKSSSKDKEQTKEEKLSSSSSKEKAEHKSSSASTTTSKSTTKDSSEAEERKRRHNSDNESNDFKSPQPKVAKIHKSSTSSSKNESKPESSPTQETEDEVVADDSFDSSMGANFNDILGMLDVPKKKSKKSLKSPSLTPTSGSNSRKETTPNRPSTSSSGSNNTPVKLNGVRTPFSSSSSYSIPSTSKAATLKPDLLAPTAILEPLDPSIALELPTISTNYKPMPLNQTVMDCVFNFGSSSSNARPGRPLTEYEAITHGISTKTQRTKIYSGVRTGQTFQVPTLFDMCIRILQKNIDALEYTGGVPFEVLRPVLDRATPQQLYNFEEYNPYVMEDSDLLWQVHVSRNYRTKKRQENESWREMYMRCQEEDEQKLSMLKNNIKASQKIASAPIRKTQMAFVDSMVKPPRNVLRKQEQYGTKSKMVATPAARVAALQSVTPNAAKTGDQRLKVPSTVRDPVNVNPVVRNKKAPLMQKTLQFIRGRLKR